MSISLRLADDDAKVIADVLKETACIVDYSEGGDVHKIDALPLVSKACRVGGAGALSGGYESMPYVAASGRLKRIAAAFDTALKANVK